MKFKEYDWQKKLQAEHGPTRLGVTSGATYINDPRRLGFMLARYKFVAKMFDGFDRVLEVGCGDGFGARVVRQAVQELVAIDTDEDFISDAVDRTQHHLPIEFYCLDVFDNDIERCGKFHGVYALDVFEHIPPALAGAFVGRCVSRLRPEGVLIVGAPSLESQKYACADAEEHINCMTGDSMRQHFKEFFENVFLFSMNDEVLHTGFSKMSHYNIVLCCGSKIP